MTEGFARYGVRVYAGGAIVPVASLGAAEDLVVELGLPWNRIVGRVGDSSPWVVVFDGEDSDDHPDDGAPRRW